MTGMLADMIFGLSPPQFALSVSAVAIIWTVARWRFLAGRRAAGRRSGGGDSITRQETAERSTGTTQRSAPVLQVREVTMEVQALLADLEETSRRLTAQLDNRYTRLEQLIVEADAKIKQLEALNGAAENQHPMRREIVSVPIAAVRPGSSSAVVASAVSDAERALQRLRAERGAPAPGDDPAYQPIYLLADAGKTSREIAQELNRQPGEIELILALRAR